MVRPSAYRLKVLVARRSKVPCLLPVRSSACQSCDLTSCEGLQSRIATASGLTSRARALWGHQNFGQPLTEFKCMNVRPHFMFAPFDPLLSRRGQGPAREGWIVSGAGTIPSGGCQGPLALQVRNMADEKLIRYYKKHPTPRDIMKAKKMERQTFRVRKEVAVKSVWKTSEYVNLVQSILLEKAWGPKTIESLEPLAIALNPRRVALILKNLTNPIVALRFFRWSGLHEGCKPTLNLYSAMIQMLVSRGMYEDMWKLLESKQPEAEKLTKLVFATIMKSYRGREGGSKDALHTYERLKDLGYYPDVVAYNCLLQILVNAGNHSNTHKVFQDMLKECLVPDTTTYTTIMHGLLQENNLTGVLNIFETMEESGCKVSMPAYNCQMSACIKLERFEEASRFLDEMRQRSFFPDVSNCSALVNHYTQKGQVDKAYKLFEAMKGKGLVRLNTSLYTTIITGLCETGRIEEADRLLDDMLSIGLDPKIEKHHLSNLVDSFSKAGARQVAIKLLNLINGEDTTF